MCIRVVLWASWAYERVGMVNGLMVRSLGVPGYRVRAWILGIG